MFESHPRITSLFLTSIMMFLYTACSTEGELRVIAVHHPRSLANRLR
jgi:hypothetical protein